MLVEFRKDPERWEDIEPPLDCDACTESSYPRLHNDFLGGQRSKSPHQHLIVLKLSAPPRSLLVLLTEPNGRSNWWGVDKVCTGEFRQPCAIIDTLITA